MARPKNRDISRAAQAIVNFFVMACRGDAWCRWQGQIETGKMQYSLCTMIALCSTVEGGIWLQSEQNRETGEITRWEIHAVHGDLRLERAVMESIAHHAGLVEMRRTLPWGLRWLRQEDVGLGRYNEVNNWAGDESTTPERIEEVLRCVVMDPRPR